MVNQKNVQVLFLICVSTDATKNDFNGIRNFVKVHILILLVQKIKILNMKLSGCKMTVTQKCVMI